MFRFQTHHSSPSTDFHHSGSNGSFTCVLPNAAYCAGDSLESNIIIRCVDGTGYAGNCNDNLVGEPPLGVSYSPCWQTSKISGNAACSKNGVVYPSDGKNNTTPFAVPGYNASEPSSNYTNHTTTRLTSTRTNVYSTTITSIITTGCENATMLDAWNTTAPRATIPAGVKVVYTTTDCSNGTMAHATEVSPVQTAGPVYITKSAWMNSTVLSTMAIAASPSATAAAGDSSEPSGIASPVMASSPVAPVYASAASGSGVPVYASGTTNTSASWSTGSPIAYTGAAPKSSRSVMLAIFGAVAAYVAL